MSNPVDSSIKLDPLKPGDDPVAWHRVNRQVTLLRRLSAVLDVLIYVLWFGLLFWSLSCVARR